MKDFHSHSHCMEHCKKLGGRSPSVRSIEEWRLFLKEMNALSPDPSRLPGNLWLSASEGYIENELGEFDHWHNNITAVEGVWRDYYTGEQLDNFTKPWQSSEGDKEYGDIYNCIKFLPTAAELRSWVEGQCSGRSLGPCKFDTPPVINPSQRVVP